MPDALDALAPATTAPVPAPAAPSPVAPAPPSPQAPAPASSAAPAAAIAPATAPAPPALDGPALLHALSEQLGIPADELRESLELTRRMRAEYGRRQEIERRADPEYQRRTERNQALDQLMVDRYGPEVARSLPMIPEIADYLHAQRAESADRDMTDALSEIGIAFDSSKESTELKDIWTDTLVDRINANPQLLQRYHGTPAERRDCLRSLVAQEERKINAALLKQHAATMRDHAQRAGSQPRGGRSVTVTPRVRQEQPTATDPTLRRREGNVIASGQLDDIWNWAH